MDIIESFKQKARNIDSRIVLPEGKDDRILQAACQIKQEGIADIILLGDESELASRADGLGLDISGCRVINPSSETEERAELAELMYELRHHKGIDREKARKKSSDPLYFGTLMVAAGKADGMVAGAANPTGRVLRPALQTIKTRSEISIVSGAFIMVLPRDEFGEKGILVMSDCAVNPEVNDDELAEIAVSTAQNTKKLLDIDPVVALLSFSTKGSARHPLVSKVRRATNKARKLAPEFEIDGELQADAALVAEIASSKAPDSQVAGRANVLIFPDLQSGNIGYKLVQRLAGAEAIGPILQGMDRPVNDLSRGCSVDDVVSLVAITALQSG